MDDLDTGARSVSQGRADLARWREPGGVQSLNQIPRAAQRLRCGPL